jgi:hypothetical protein
LRLAGAEKQDSLVRVLAEPNVMAISGQEGSFLAGGKFYVPVAQDNNRVTLEEKEFGVGLRFTPTVLAGGRINLRVAPEVSELSREGIGISATGINGTAILPVVTTRRASTTVQLYDGQSFAIGGLIKNNLVTNLKGLPVLGEMPMLGALFRSTDYQQDRTELVFVITAHLVKPLPGPGYELPTDKVGVPSRAAADARRPPGRSAPEGQHRGAVDAGAKPRPRKRRRLRTEIGESDVHQTQLFAVLRSPGAAAGLQHDPALQRNFGASVRANLAAQVIDPAAGERQPGLRHGRPRRPRAQERYQRSFKPDPAPQPSIGGSGAK